jgi:hypothetical protein
MGNNNNDRSAAKNFMFTRIFPQWKPSVKPWDSKPIKNHLGGNNDKNHYFTMADGALPQVLIASKSLTNRIKDEIKRQHRWLAVIFFFSQRFPRVLRIASLATNIICMLFIQSLTYNLTNADDGTCERLRTEAACLSPKSPYATGSSKCYWAYNDVAAAHCKIVQPDDDLTVVVFVAVFSAIVSTPISLLTQWIIEHILSAPTKQFPRRSDQSQSRSFNQNLRIMPIINETRDNVDQPIQNKLLLRQRAAIPPRHNSQWTVFSNNAQLKPQQFQMDAQIDLVKLTQELKAYRPSLIDDTNDLNEFDSKYSIIMPLNFCVTVTPPLLY